MLKKSYNERIECLTKKWVGALYESRSYGTVVVVEVMSLTHVKVRFLRTKYEYIIQRGAVKRGSLKDPLQPTVCGVGVTGLGDYSPPTHPKHYSLWTQMLARCYSDKYSNPWDYTDCFVSDEFKNFQVFASWCDSQIGFNVKGFDLDKDLLSCDVKIYSTETCAFIPEEINLILRFPKKKSIYRGVLKTPVGKYTSTCNTSFGIIYLGTFNTPEDAFYAYKEVKEDHIKSLADKYKDVIDPRAYEALMNWTINIDD